MSALSSLPDSFLCFRRAYGGVGTRNHLLVVPSVVCANTVAQRVATLIPGAVSVPHPHGCAQVGDDVVLTEKVLAGAAANPNVGAALVIGLGCETCQSGEVAELARSLAPGKPVEAFSIQEAGGSIKAISRGVEAGKRLLNQIAAQRREQLPVSELVLARDRGHDDAGTLTESDPVTQRVEQLVLAAGGTVLVPDFLARADERESALSFAERPTSKGRHVMRTPDVDNVSVSAMAAGGSQVCLFSTGKGSPLGNAVCPVIKVCGDADTTSRMADNIDFSSVALTHGGASADELSEQLFRMLIDVSSGQLTNAEIIGHQEFAIHRVGPTV